MSWSSATYASTKAASLGRPAAVHVVGAHVDAHNLRTPCGRRKVESRAVIAEAPLVDLGDAVLTAGANRVLHDAHAAPTDHTGLRDAHSAKHVRPRVAYALLAEPEAEEPTHADGRRRAQHSERGEVRVAHELDAARWRVIYESVAL